MLCAPIARDVQAWPGGDQCRYPVIPGNEDKGRSLLFIIQVEEDNH